MEKQNIQIAYGKANLSNMLATYGAMKVTAPFDRVSAATTGVKLGYPNTTRVGRHEHNGVIVSCGVQHDNGTILLLTASWKRGGASIRDGAIFLKLRHGAAHYNIVAKVPVGQESLSGDTFIMFSGCADILNINDLKVLGIEASRSYIGRFMDMEELGECFSITQIAREVIPRPTLSAISTPGGIELREVAQEAPRRLRLRG